VLPVAARFNSPPLAAMSRPLSMRPNIFLQDSSEHSVHRVLNRGLWQKKLRRFHLITSPSGLLGYHEQGRWDNNDPGHDSTPVLAELKKMRAQGRGVIGMKIIGDGEFIHPEDREKSIRFAMSRPELDAVVIGFKKTGEIDEAIQRMNLALATPA
jgi:hypothetical protein